MNRPSLNLLYYGYFYFFRLLRHRVFCTTLQHTKQHVVSTPSTYPGSCKTCFSCKPVFGGKISLIFPIIYQIAHLHNWPSFPLIFADNTLDDLFSSLGGYFELISHSWLLNFIETRHASFDPFDITLKSIGHVKTSFLVNCAGGTQGVQFLD